jgi:subtilisin family serine protease
MSKRIYVMFLSILLAFGLFANMFSSIGPVTHAQQSGSQFDRTQIPNESPVGDLTEAPSQTGEVNVMIELVDDPTAKVYARTGGNNRGNSQQHEQARGSARAQLARIQAAQNRVLAHLGSPGMRARVLYSVQSAYNGIAARVDAGDVDKIKAHADVKAVNALPIHYIDNSTSVPFIKAVNAWVAAGGNAGDGIRIGIIDTGIDYTHADFGGPGTAAAYTANNRAIIEPGTFPTAKVVGGRDFAGDAYTGANVPVPDPDPLDCNSHGTHVAGTAAGFGVKSDGTTYTGPYDGTTPFSSLRIGPGVAPKAQLYALKVFGCSGSTGLTTQAINWSVDPNGDGDPSDHLDVINMSLGSNFGTATDSSATASSNAAAVGVIVVAASGNAGDTTYITSTPASSTSAISVANIVDNGITGTNLKINSPPAIAGDKSALPAAFNPPMSLPASFTASVKLANDDSTAPFPGSPVGTVGTTTDGCQSFPPGFFAGQHALIDRGGGCGFVDKVKNAQNAGATAVIVANNVAGTISMGGTDPTIVIPSLSIQQIDGNAIKAQLGVGVNGTLQFFDLGDTVSGSSSRGPRRNGAGAKPEISAPGTTITSAGMGTGNGTLIISGTSMATPHVTGAMGLLRQLHPTWSVEELKALIMNTSNHDLFTGNSGLGSKYAVARIGAGRIDLENASESEVIAYSDDDPGAVSVSFGTPEIVGSASLTRTVRVTNKGAFSANYNLGYVGLSDVPGVDYSFPDGTSIAVPAGDSITFPIQLTANAASMKHPRDVTMASTQAGNPRHYMSEESGYVTLTPSGGTMLRVPVYAAPRPASNMATNHNYVLFTGPTGSTNIGLTGQDVNTGNSFPVDEVSFVSAFELQEISPANIPGTSAAKNADLKSVGVTSDFKATNSVVASTKIFFAIATHGQWSTPSDVTFNIFIDRDMNGTDDFQLINTSFADANGNNLDVFVSARRPSPFTGGLSADSFINNASSNLDTVLFNTNMMIIPVTASAIGLTTANAKFKYRVTSTSRGFGGTIDQTSGYRTYDAANPGFDVTGGFAGLPLYGDLNGGTIPVNYNKANYQGNGSLGLLLLHHHNGFGAHDQILSVVEPTSTSVTVDPASGVYSDPVNLRATVSPASYLDQTVSGNVQFLIDGSPVGAAVPVDSGGVAMTSYTVNVAAGSHTITAAFSSTNSGFLNSSNTGTLTVSREDATVSASGSNPDAVKVSSPGGTADSAVLCFNIDEVSDGSAGDTTNATPVTFSMAPIGGGPSITPSSVSYSGGGVGATRTACATFINVPVNVYDVTATIGGNYYQGSGKTVLTVYDPSLGFVTGGGTIIHNGYKANFGLNIKYLKNGNAQGSFLYIEHRPTGDLVLKSNALGNLAIVGTEAIPNGKATLNGVGNHNFIGRIIDNGEPGINDQFGLRVTNPNGTVVIDLTFDPITLSGGNVSVPKQTGK